MLFTNTLRLVFLYLSNGYRQDATFLMSKLLISRRIAELEPGKEWTYFAKIERKKEQSQRARDRARGIEPRDEVEKATEEERKRKESEWKQKEEEWKRKEKEWRQKEEERKQMEEERKQKKRVSWCVK